MKVRFTGAADGAATYAGKYEVTTGSVLDVSETEANALLQTGVFEAVEDDTGR
jgi:acetaldehyde dehydrogenase (acetylating)